MQSNAVLRVVENNSLSSKNFTIQASGKMFHMVIAGLYSNKPESITRELWSNAYDAHAMVGKEDVPFEVTLPTSLTPVFTCRDFGPGIAHEDMEGFYTVLGHSTKENTNKAVGKWGVGRMSPMSYTDTFSVTSRHKGMVSYYSIQLGPDGSPNLHVLAPPSPTTEADGLEVSFPVKSYDLTSFQQAANKVALGFPVTPTIRNSKEKSFTPLKKLYEGKEYILYEGAELKGAYAQMGCVLYPIPSQYLYDYIGRTRSIIYKFEIGALEVTASRESLSFGPNDPTTESIKTLVKKVEEDIFQAIQGEIEAQPSPFRAAKLASKLRAFVSKGEFRYKGLLLPKVWAFEESEKYSLHCGYKGHRQKYAGFGTERTISFGHEPKVFVQDTSDKKGCVGAASRIGYALPQYTYYLWVKVNLKNAEHKAAVDALIADLGYPVSYVSDLPAATPSGSTRAKVQVSRLTHRGLEKWALDNVEYEAGGYYYPMISNQYPDYLRQSLPLIKEKLKVSEAMMVPKTLWKKFEDNPKWKLLEPAFEAAVKEEADKAKAALGQIYNTYPMSELSGLIYAGGPVGAFSRKLQTPSPSEYLGLSRGAWNALLKMYNLGGITNAVPETEYKKILDVYPLLSLYSRGHRQTQDFVAYIKMIDKLNAAKE